MDLEIRNRRLPTTAAAAAYESVRTSYSDNEQCVPPQKQRRINKIRSCDEEFNSDKCLAVLALIGVVTLAIVLIVLAALGNLSGAHHTHEHCESCCSHGDVIRHHSFEGAVDQYECIHKFDFENGDGNEYCEFKYFERMPGVPANDAAGGVTFPGGDAQLCIDSRPFESSVPMNASGPSLFGTQDHVKFLVFLSDQNDTSQYATYNTDLSDRHDYCGGDTMELVYEMNATCVAELGDIPYPGEAIRFPQEDPRLAACAMNAVALPDENTQVGDGAFGVFDFLLANEQIFALYERLPFGRPSVGGAYNEYSSFTSMVPVARRRKHDYHKLSIAFNRARGVVRWLIDDKEVYRVDRVGFRLPLCDVQMLPDINEGELEYPKTLSMGFGTFTLLDFHQFNNGTCTSEKPLARLVSGANAYYNPYDRDATSGNPKPNVDFYDETPAEEKRIWGQGAKFTIDYIEVRTQKCGCSL